MKRNPGVFSESSIVATAAGDRVEKVDSYTIVLGSYRSPPSEKAIVTQQRAPGLQDPDDFNPRHRRNLTYA
nr:hypothetical protein CFP56_00688 [Quercus suber]